MTPVCFYHFEEWGVRLLCPISMASMRMDDIMIQSNGCGREGIEARIIPDSFFGLSVSPACRVHDIMYQQAIERARRHKDQARLTAEEHFADGIMACNLVQIINNHSGNRFMRWLRLRIASRYIRATSVTDVLTVLPEPVLVAMGYDTATAALEDMTC